MGEFRPWHIAIILIAFIVLFGYKKLPDASRSIGRSLRIFKAETKGLRGDDEAEASADEAPVARRSVQGTDAAHPVAAQGPVEARSGAGTPVAPAPAAVDADRAV